MVLSLLLKVPSLPLPVIHEPSTNGGGIYNGGTLNLSSETVIMNNSAAQTGGGICNAGTVVVPVGVKLYNNHANIAGDDIYSRDNSTITFAAVGSDWILDDCSEAITGWFDDSENDRWNGEDGDGICHAVEFTEFSNGVATVTGLHALKASAWHYGYHRPRRHYRLHGRRQWLYQRFERRR